MKSNLIKMIAVLCLLSSFCDASQNQQEEGVNFHHVSPPRPMQPSLLNYLLQDQENSDFSENLLMTEYRRMAREGHLVAQFNLDQLYASDQGGSQNYTLARPWCERVTGQNDLRD